MGAQKSHERKGSQDMKVLMTYIGDYWLDDGRAVKLTALLSSNKTTMIDLDGSAIMLSQVQGLVTAEAYKLTAFTKKRNWVCKLGSGHAWNEHCQCKVALQPTNAPQLAEATPLTPEQELEQERRTTANLAWLNMHKKNFKAPEFKDKVKRQKFIDEYKISV